MELTSDIQYLRSRRDELERRMRQPGGIRIIEERELLQLRMRLQELPRMPADPPVAPEALKPYLGRFSPYGPPR